MKELLIESPCLNKKDGGKSSCPFNKMSVIIHTNDHNPPHFHVEYDDWDVSFYIENGEEYRTNKNGRQTKLYKDMKKSVKKWILEKCVEKPQYTNKDNLLAVWRLHHGR